MESRSLNLSIPLQRCGGASHMNLDLLHIWFDFLKLQSGLIDG